MNSLRVATQDDVDVIADLIQEKRLQYENYQPTFLAGCIIRTRQPSRISGEGVGQRADACLGLGGNPRGRGRVHHCQHHCRAAGL